MLTSNLSNIEIYIHGYRVEKAKSLLKSKLDSAPKGTRYITVYHGFNRGTALQTMVRKYKHPRINRIEIGLRNGETTYYLFIVR